MRKLTENTLHILIHELKNPLTVIRGYSELLKDERDEKFIEKYSNIIAEQTDYATYLVNNITTFNKLQENIPIAICKEPYPIYDICENLINIYREKNSHITWINKIPKRIEVNTDRSLFNIIMFNLIENASKYTLEGSVTIKAQKKDNQVIFTIEDTGIGISKHKLSHITKLFYRATDEIPGTGIGLYLVDSISKKLNIELKIKSKENIGTKISLII